MHSVPDRQWLWLAAALYLTGFILGTIRLFGERKKSTGLTYGIVVVGFALQTIGLNIRGMAVHGCPIGNLFEIFQFSAWSATALYLVIGATFRLSLLGYFTACLAAVLTVVSLSVPSWDAVRAVNVFHGNHWIEFHAALALFSYGVFGLLALTSIMYLMQVHSLKSQHLQGFFSFLPSVLDLDHISLRLLTAGVVLMTASLIVGSIYWVQDTEMVNLTKLFMTAGLWVAYLAVFGLRMKSFLVAKRLAWACIALFALAVISLWPVNSSRKPLPEKSATHAFQHS
ncbi:MAG TPA: cytochrome c biogenesis protein CcsA [Opitutaceae bacterium]|nr:cytochrome c biogenesis protein CcsA [Opitutaceae bacterium]